ncbi:MDR/zinc-dependent alcohol dehydrogenase-like family protein [Wenxinia marina]|uniref:Wenxma_16, whole genome shotgun sequence n=1 Tax=Wenxinia marina DSM 24838 TaxID=1123501 RepID=A0A0D0NID6_9RHOB|nr:zinc-binding dehydrogenase [Wenxinia marina]KIQ68095.1 Threonine dehydrogenase [Wenxinia marina DSM 24838]GGL78184.1 oxidoreductase [Wenxinia marina]
MPDGTRQAVLRAAEATAPGEVRIVERPLSGPGPGEIRVRLEGCGVCASNLEPWAGQPWMSWPLAPGELGHEGWGRVEAVGDGVGTFVPGDRVAILGYRSYASHDTVPVDRAVPLPQALDGQPVPGEALGCAVSIFRKSGIGAGDTVAIVGTGFIGLLLVQLATAAGARVIALARRDAALDLAREMGAVETVRTDDHGATIARVRELTGGKMADVAIEAAGHQWPLDLAAELTRMGGRLVIAGFHQGPRQVNMLDWNWRALEIVNAHERDEAKVVDAMREGIAQLAEGALTLTPLLTHDYPLAEVGRALDATRDKPDGFVKAWVRC